ncbi:hypothetical protein [Chryseobacterium piperi]|nr:hypothetical protein [Chryseobacterium piperi]
MKITITRTTSMVDKGALLKRLQHNMFTEVLNIPRKFSDIQHTQIKALV